MMMTNLRYALLLLLAVVGAASCHRSENAYQPPASANNYSGTAPSVSTSTATVNRELTASQVEAAVSEMLSGYRLSGGVRVRGIRELPLQNSAVADLQFESFEYPVTFEGRLIKTKDFKVKKPSGAAIPPPDEMFPPRRVSYSKDGRAALSRYTDGRWVLKQVNWAFDTGVKGTVEIR